MVKLQYILLFLSIILPAAGSLTYPQISKEEFQRAADYCISKLLKEAELIPENKFPIRTKGTGEWEYTDPEVWTSGFFPGSLWYAYKLKPEKKIREAAEKLMRGLENQKFNKNHHDIGFMMFNSFGNGYKITGNDIYKEVIMQSAYSLATRFNKKAGCIQSWNGEFQVIIDNMMNLEILFWASDNSTNKNFREMAISHADETIKNHLREDGTSFHVVVYDTSSGSVIKKRTAQGFADSSCWARGQAWGIYGFTMAFRETQDKKYLAAAVKLAEYFIDNLPTDYVPYWDFRLPAGNPRIFKDASAAAIALSALLELKNYIDHPAKYEVASHEIMKSLIQNYLSTDSSSAGLLLHCAYNVNSKNPWDWDAATVWGDYYFMEALIRYKDSFELK